jgi:hypothetical protein
MQYDHFITKVPTGRFNSNFAYFWHCVLAFNLFLIFKSFVLTGDWNKARTSTLRNELIAIPGRLVNRSGRMIMRMMAGFPYSNVLQTASAVVVSMFTSCAGLGLYRQLTRIA